MSPKKFFIFILPFFISAYAEAQTVKVTKENARVKGENVEGFGVSLEGVSADISSAYIKYLKTFGKVKQTTEIVVNEPTVLGITYTSPFYGLIKENGNKSTAWLGLIASEWKDGDDKKLNEYLERALHEFGVKFYRDKIQTQIDEAQRAVQAVEKQQQRLVNENKSLNTKIENNKNEKIQLEKSLVNNKVELETLVKKIESNKKAQDSVAIATEQIKKAVEMHKERQRKVN
jgi:hypothetical protein